MMDEQLEFAISQYADGTLPPSQAAALEVQIASDPELAAVLQEYRQLGTAVATLVTAVPPINWDRFAIHLSDRVAGANDQSDSLRIYSMPWVRRVAGLAVAACLAIVIGIGVEHRSHPAIQAIMPAPIVPGEVAVAGPSADAPAGAVIQEINIGPGPSVAMDDSTWRYGDSGVVSQAQRVVIATSDAPAQDTTATPY